MKIWIGFVKDAKDRKWHPCCEWKLASEAKEWHKRWNERANHKLYLAAKIVLYKPV